MNRPVLVTGAAVNALWLGGLLTQWLLFRSRVVTVLATRYEAAGVSLGTLLQIGYRTTEWLQWPLAMLALLLLPLAWGRWPWIPKALLLVTIGLALAQVVSAVVFLRTCMELVTLL